MIGAMELSQPPIRTAPRNEVFPAHTSRNAPMGPETFKESRIIAKRGGKVAGVARKETEKELGRSVSTPDNFLPKSGNLILEE